MLEYNPCGVVCQLIYYGNLSANPLGEASHRINSIPQALRALGTDLILKFYTKSCPQQILSFQQSKFYQFYLIYNLNMYIVTQIEIC